MSADKHTPGPWITTVRIQDKVDVLHGMPDTPGAASRTVARVTVRDSWRAEQEANARLIAAAPELLAACQALLANAEAGLTNLGAMRAARAAIAKATGEPA